MSLKALKEVARRAAGGFETTPDMDERAADEIEALDALALEWLNQTTGDVLNGGCLRKVDALLRAIAKEAE